MAFNAGDPRVRRTLVADVLRLHHGMTGLTAKLRGIHHGNAVICSGGEDACVRQCRKRDYPAQTCDLWSPVRQLLKKFPVPAALRSQHQAQGHKTEPRTKIAGMTTKTIIATYELSKCWKTSSRKTPADAVVKTTPNVGSSSGRRSGIKECERTISFASKVILQRVAVIMCVRYDG